MLMFAALLMLVIAAYAQVQLGHFTRGAAATWATRALLVLLGLGVGYVFVRTSTPPPSDPTALFALGFGLVHLPAALVLMLKGIRGEGRS